MSLTLSSTCGAAAGAHARCSAAQQQPRWRCQRNRRTVNRWISSSFLPHCGTSFPPSSDWSAHTFASIVAPGAAGHILASRSMGAAGAGQ
jgi:hypothetical protein